MLVYNQPPNRTFVTNSNMADSIVSELTTNSFRVRRLPQRYQEEPDDPSFQTSRKRQRSRQAFHESPVSKKVNKGDDSSRVRRYLNHVKTSTGQYKSVSLCDMVDNSFPMLVATNTPTRLYSKNINSTDSLAEIDSLGGLSELSSNVTTPPNSGNLNVTVILASSNGNNSYDIDDMEVEVDIEPSVVEKKLRKNVRNRLWQIIRQTLNMNESAEQLVGCSMDQYRNYIERQFAPGMSWMNHGAWHIDHIKALSTFRLVDPLERAKAFHYTNTRPLWAHLNLSKGISPVTIASTYNSNCC